MHDDPKEKDEPLLEANEDLEDGEIEDDDDEEETSVPTEIVPQKTPDGPIQQPNLPTPNKNLTDLKTPIITEKVPKDKSKVRDKSLDLAEKHRAHEEKKKHMTEAEKSILHLRKRERMQRDWDKYGRTTKTEAHPQYNFLVDDYARNIEKSLANVLKKEKTGSEDEIKEEDKRGRKRKRHDRERKSKRKIESPKSEEIDEIEMLNIQGGSPLTMRFERPDRTPSLHSEESYESENNMSDQNRPEERRPSKKEFKGKNKGARRERREKKYRNRENRAEQQLKDAQGVCVFYLQGKCQKNDCPYSHEAVPPMKLELCKFYLMDCCAKGEKCSYMHSEFPCKFYHTGLNCHSGDECKFAHGKPLSDDCCVAAGLKQILFKHIETAPRDILGGFPRMSREEALNMINITQKSLHEQYNDKKDDKSNASIPSLFDINIPIPPELADETKPKEKNDKPVRNRPSRWQDADPKETSKLLQDQQINLGFGLKPFAYGQDLDMRISSNGDVDMRTLPPSLGHNKGIQLPNLPVPQPDVKPDLDVEQYKREAGFGNLNSTTLPNQDVDIRNVTIPSFNSAMITTTSTGDVDIRQQILDSRLYSSKDVDNRQIPGQGIINMNESGDTSIAPTLDLDASATLVANVLESFNIPANLPKTQRDLFMRIKAQQKENIPESHKDNSDNEDNTNNINWYSDDDDDDENRLMIKVDNEDGKDDNQMETETVINPQIMSPPQVQQLKPQEVVEKLGDLSKIDISAEVSKLLSTITQKTILPSTSTLVTKEETKPAQKSTPIKDPRQAINDPRTGASATVSDPRMAARKTSTESNSSSKPEKISIYEQGSINLDKNSEEPDFGKLDSDYRGSGRPDVDLRSLQLPFKGMQNYTPATEIDASINSHKPFPWKISIVEIPRPDYTGLKLNVSDAEKTGDPRLRKIFRLSIEEKDSPASPKQSPKTSSAVRADPRLKKNDETKGDPVIMNYMQQLNMLQSSVFYQSLTSNQKLLLNQELSMRSDQSGSHDPLLNSLLTNLNLIPSNTIPSSPQQSGMAQNILANINKLNPMISNQSGPAVLGQNVNPNILNQNPTLINQNPTLMNQMAQSMLQPGLLGAAPGIPNLPPDFPINFDLRNGGLLGSAPAFQNFQQEGNNYSGGVGNNFNDEYYPDNGGNNFGHSGNNNRSERGFNRDRRRGRNNNFNRNNGNRNFRNRNNNRSNRSHTPP